ncbi:MAG TPA: non-homologous end-joining DNA ligase, partial [Chitinophagaceae bacterium]|nr:non-homologous end-joining DNA ligase [Chitinophagaceae bacterium]
KEIWTLMQSYVQEKSPFDKKISVNSAVTWLKPNLVCEVKYTEMTRDGILRHPVFLRLRDDKSAKEVKPESAKTEKMKTKTASKKTAVKKAATKKAATKKAATKKAAPQIVSDEKSKVLVFNKHQVELSNINKIYWPEEKLTKGDMLNYYESVADYILPYLKGRPLSLNRHPGGITDKGFYHKNAGDIAPSWMDTKEVISGDGKKIDYLVCNNIESLLFVANLGCIEMNPWNSTTKKMENPTWMVIDIDPSDGNTFEEVIETAQVVKSILDRAKVKSYCKTSGSSGLHVYVPMGAKYDYEQVKNFANIIAMLVTQELPDSTTLERSLSKRSSKKIYVDYLQNRRGQTLATTYSLRPKPGAPVSMPLE